MAKFTKLLGSARGRVGGLVFSRGENGENYVRSYQPTVYNPKSSAQKGQRAKMNLVGRMSQVTPSVVIAGIEGSSGRLRRSRFNSWLLKVAVLDATDPNSIVAKIVPEDVLFSEGSATINARVSTPMAVTANTVTIGLTLEDAGLANGYGEKIIVAIVDPSQKGGYSMIVASDNIFENTTAKSIVINVPAGIADGSLVSVYRVPFLLSEDGTAAISTTTIYTDGSDILARLLAGSSAVRLWGRSVLVGSQVFTQA